MIWVNGQRVPINNFPDGLTWKEANHALNHLQPIFKDGHLLKESNLYEIRNRLHKFNF